MGLQRFRHREGGTISSVRTDARTAPASAASHMPGANHGYSRTSPLVAQEMGAANGGMNRAEITAASGLEMAGNFCVAEQSPGQRIE